MALWACKLHHVAAKREGADLTSAQAKKAISWFDSWKLTEGLTAFVIL